jgi:hypothetical protein
VSEVLGEGRGLPVKTSWEGGFFQTSVFAGAERANEAMMDIHGNSNGGNGDVIV